MEKAKEKIYTKKYFHAIVCLALALLAALEFLPFLCAKLHSGHDLKYHFGVIRSLSVAWDNGNFFGKIMELVGGDYGYGTGLFYSTLPAGISVTLMKTLRLSVVGSIYLEIVLLFAGSGILVYFFLRRVFGDNRIAAIGGAVYLLFPYCLWDVYVRFAFSEIFLMLTIPMIAWGVYELLYRDNRAAFLTLFAGGYALSILLHFTMSVYVTLFVAVWLLVRAKKTFTKKNLLTFGVAVVVVVLLTAAYWVPMLSNYSVTKTESLGRNAKTLFKNSIGGFGNFYLLTGFLYVLSVGALYAAAYFRTPKANRSGERLAIVTLWMLLIVMYSPIFPWALLPEVMGMIQYPFRLMLFGGILTALQTATLLRDKYFAKASEVEESAENTGVDGRKSARLRAISLCVCAALCVANVVGMPFSLLRRVISTTRAETVTAEFSGFDEFLALGVRKHGDYFPDGCTEEYVNTRMNAQMVAETDVSVYELANYSALSQASFLTDKSGYVVLNIPYALLAGAELYRFETAYTNQRLSVAAESCDGGAKTKLTFAEYDGESKVILSYQKAPALQAYLQENAFGVLVLEGDVTATNLQKERAGKYSVEVATGQNGGILELPSYYYKGYKLRLKRADGSSVEVVGKHGRNGFLEAEITESGTLYVEYAADEFNFAYVLTGAGAVGGVGALVFAWVLQRKKREKTEE